MDLVSVLGRAMLSTPAPGAPPVPYTDWQFWVVTIVAIGAAGWIIRRLLPKRLFGKPKRGVAKRATLTVGGQPLDHVRESKGSDCH